MSEDGVLAEYLRIQAKMTASTRGKAGSLSQKNKKLELKVKELERHLEAERTQKKEVVEGVDAARKIFDMINEVQSI